jgi:hypothetical protein
MSTIIKLSSNQQPKSTESSLSANNEQQLLSNNNNNNNNNTTNAAILARLKEVEHANQSMQLTIDGLQVELKGKDESIQKLHVDNKELSADKRKDMEQIVETAVDDWLNSLTGISSDVRKQFRDGVTRLAEQADMKNNAWEVVCNASKAYKENVNTIEQLKRDCNERDKTIETLLSSHSDPTFTSDSSRIAGSKRQRGDDVEVITNRSQVQEKDSHATPSGDAWDDFAKLLSNSGKSHYY